MIHTFFMYSNLDVENVEICSDLLNVDYIQASDILSNIRNGITATISNIYGGWKLFLFVDVIKLLNRSDINEEDYSVTQNIIDNFSMTYFGEILDFTLTRIEYRIDISMPRAEREFLLRRYKKIIDKYYFARKNIYKDTVYHSNKSKSKIIYDKEEERNAKEFTIEPYEKDVLRYETKLLNSHLYYQKRQHSIDRTLENYWKLNLHKEYFAKEFKPLLYPGDYYKLYDITKILNISNLKQKYIDEIPNFLTKISRNGISKAKVDYSPYMFKKYLKILEDLNINPIIIPKNEKSLSNNKYMKNPLSKIFV